MSCRFRNTRLNELLILQHSAVEVYLFYFIVWLYRTCVHSVYCLEEFKIALHHNIVVKRKKRLIVLMALDNPADLQAHEAPETAALRQYLRQYTYIDYTADDWLNKLLYALPLHGMNQAQQAHQQRANLDNNDALLLQ